MRSLATLTHFRRNIDAGEIQVRVLPGKNCEEKGRDHTLRQAASREHPDPGMQRCLLDFVRMPACER